MATGAQTGSGKTPAAKTEPTKAPTKTTPAKPDPAKPEPGTPENPARIPAPTVHPGTLPGKNPDGPGAIDPEQAPGEPEIGPVVVDTPEIVEPESNASVPDGNVVFTGLGTKGCTVQLHEGAEVIGEDEVTDSKGQGKWSIKTELSPGQHTVWATQSDKDGAVSDSTEGVTVHVPEPPPEEDTSEQDKAERKPKSDKEADEKFADWLKNHAADGPNQEHRAELRAQAQKWLDARGL